MARIANSLATLRSQYNAKYPNRNKASDGWIGDAAHQATKSDHNPDSRGIVAALDVTHDPARGLNCAEEVEKIIRDSRVKYVIFNRRIWEPGIGWKAYSGPSPHTEHMHISVKASNYDDAREWNLSTPQGGSAVVLTTEDVKVLYRRLFNREGDPGGVKNYTGKTLEFALGDMLGSQEFKNIHVKTVEKIVTVPGQTVDPVIAAKAAKYDKLKEALN